MGTKHQVTGMEVLGDERAAGDSERVAGLWRSVEAAAFWAAILAPLGYVPFLTVGIDGAETAVAFGALVAFHLVALTVGHAYGR